MSAAGHKVLTFTGVTRAPANAEQATFLASAIPPVGAAAAMANEQLQAEQLVPFMAAADANATAGCAHNACPSNCYVTGLGNPPAPCVYQMASTATYNQGQWPDCVAAATMSFDWDTPTGRIGWNFFIVPYPSSIGDYATDEFDTQPPGGPGWWTSTSGPYGADGHVMESLLDWEHFVTGNWWLTYSSAQGVGNSSNGEAGLMSSVTVATYYNKHPAFAIGNTAALSYWSGNGTADHVINILGYNWNTNQVLVGDTAFGQTYWISLHNLWGFVISEAGSADDGGIYY